MANERWGMVQDKEDTSGHQKRVQNLLRQYPDMSYYDGLLESVISFYLENQKQPEEIGNWQQTVEQVRDVIFYTGITQSTTNDLQGVVQDVFNNLEKENIYLVRRQLCNICFDILLYLEEIQKKEEESSSIFYAITAIRKKFFSE